MFGFGKNKAEDKIENKMEEKEMNQTLDKTIKLGKEGKDKITGFQGIITAKVEYLYGCNQYGLTPKVGEDGTTKGSEFFDEGRIEVIGNGILPEEVKVEKNGGINRDAPSGLR